MPQNSQNTKAKMHFRKKKTKELIEIIAIRMEKGIKDYIDEKFLTFTRDIVKKNKKYKKSKSLSENANKNL